MLNFIGYTVSAEYYTEVKEIIRIQLAAPLSLLIPDLVNIIVIDDDESDHLRSRLERDFFMSVTKRNSSALNIIHRFYIWWHDNIR